MEALNFGQATPAAPEPGPAPQEGRHLRLRPVTPMDYDFLYRTSMREEINWRWRHRGATPSLDQFVQSLWQGVMAAFLIEQKSTGRPMGLIFTYSPNFQHGFTYLGMLLAPEYKRAAWSMEAGALFLHYVFTTWNFRKVYMETLEFNFAQFRSGAGKYFDVEGCLRQHEYYQGRYWDYYLLAIYRDVWEKHARRVLPHILPRKPAIAWEPPRGWRGGPTSPRR